MSSSTTRHRDSVQHGEIATSEVPGLLGLKVLVTTVRQKDSDLVDVWRCLEICFAAGVRTPDSRTDHLEVTSVLRRQFARESELMDGLVTAQQLNAGQAEQLRTRMVALIDVVLGR